mgnify:CR=1 FL=1
MDAKKLDEFRQLANEKLSYFGAESKAADAINALIAEVERLTKQVDGQREVIRNLRNATGI